MIIKVIDGPNINLLGQREKEIYGEKTYGEFREILGAAACEYGVELKYFQSNHEGFIIDEIQKDDYDCLIINAGGLTHHSISIADAIKGMNKKAIEVHLSNIFARPGRDRSTIAPVCHGIIAGFGISGYILALGQLSQEMG